MKDILKILNDIVDNDEYDSHQKLAYLVLLRYSNKEGVCYPSYQTIAKNMGCSKSKAIQSIKKLVDNGIIHKEIVRDNSKSMYNRNNYTLLKLKQFKPKQKADICKKEKYKKTSFHNFTPTFDKYSEEELENLIEESQSRKWGN